MRCWWRAISNAWRTTPPIFPKMSSSGFWEPTSVIMRRRRPRLRGRRDRNSRSWSDGRLARPRFTSRAGTPAASPPIRGTLFEPMSRKIRVFATCDIGDAINILRRKGYDLEVYPQPEAPPKSVIIEKVKPGVDGLITTLRDEIDAEVFAAGEGT